MVHSVGTEREGVEMALEKRMQDQSIPPGIVAAFDKGVLSREPLRTLIEAEARQFGLTLDEALSLAKRGALPGPALAVGLDFLINLLDD